MINFDEETDPIYLRFKELLAILNGYNTTYNVSDNINISTRVKYLRISFDVICINPSGVTKFK